MTRILYSILFSFFIPYFAFSQSDLQKLNSQIKTASLKAEDVDRIVIQLYKIEPISNDGEQNRMLFETYRLAANGYVSNNHFKQAHFIYRDYLALKEKTLAKEKAGLIASKVLLNSEKAARMNTGISNLKNTISVLESNEQLLKKRGSNLLRNALLMVIFISGLFAIVFLKFSVTIKKFKDEIKVYKDQLLGLEKTALVGRIKDPVIANNHRQLEITRHEVNALQKLLKQLEPVVVKEKMNDFKKAKESFGKAENDLKVLAKE